MDEKITSRENAKVKYACRLASSGAFRRAEGRFLAEGRKLCPELARGAQLDNGKMTERIKALVPVLVPLFISAFRRADELAMAMECRCYRGGEGRTRLKVLRCEKQDYIDLAVCIACFAVILASRLVFPNY